MTSLYNYEVSHYFRLNNNIWNTKIDKISFNDYDFIVLDNYPLYKKDNIIADNILSEYKNKIIYFIGPDNVLPNHKLYEYCNCVYSRKNNNITNIQTNLFKYNDKMYTVAPPETLCNIKCKNSIFNYDTQNTILYEHENILLFFINNLYSFKNSIDLLKNESLYIVDDYFNDFIYTNSKYLNLFTNQSQYSIHDTLEVYLQINNIIPDDDMYLDILNEDYSLNNRIVHNKKINNDLFLFKSQINSNGTYYLKAFLTSNQNKIESNLIEIIFSDYTAEERDIYLNSNLLIDISNKTDGIFSNYNEIDYFLDNIKFSNSNSVNYQRNNLISYPYLFLVIIFLLLIEWYYRNKIGLI